jgi:ATP-dependent exoDNAse (exonuclease V) alpha subunit
MAACLRAGRQQGGFLESINGILSRIHFHKDGFLIGRLNSGEGVLGGMDNPCLGQEYRFRGDWVDNPKYGRQFKFLSYQIEVPQTADGIYRYIVKTAKWVGPEIGRHIVEAFGEKTLMVLKHDPLHVANSIKGITLERAQEISEMLIENEYTEAAQVELEGILDTIFQRRFHSLSKIQGSCTIQSHGRPLHPPKLRV